MKYHAFQIKSLPSPLLLLLFLPPSKFLGVFRAVVCSLFFPLSPARHEFWKVVAGGSGEDFLLSWGGGVERSATRRRSFSGFVFRRKILKVVSGRVGAFVPKKRRRFLL